MAKKINPSHRVAIIGAGNVGASIAYSILNQEITKEILIMDIAEDLAKAQVLDMQDASNFTHGVKVTFANYDDLEDGDVVVITCGAAQKEGQTRVELLGINTKIIRDVISKIKKTKKTVYIIMVTNPVDVLTYIAATESGLPEGMVFGSGTYLDTARLRNTLSKKLDLNGSNIHAYIIGEHGDTSLPVLSSCNIGGMPLEKFITIDKEFYKNVAQEVRDTAYEIIKGKKSTYYGIGSAIAKIVKAIIRNEKKIIPLSVILNGEYGYKDVCIGVPAKISSKGVEVIGEIGLNKEESNMFKTSVDFVKENIKTVL
jgi:L-lactate dehydrogenase